MGYGVELIHRRPMAADVIEVGVTRPPGFSFLPGQHIRLHWKGRAREYSPVSAASDDQIRICVKRMGRSGMSARLFESAMGERFELSGPYGYFVYHPSGTPAVFVGTGTGVAPFVAFAGSGVSDYIFLQGARNPDQLIYMDELREKSRLYVPCLSRPGKGGPAGAFQGRVTQYLKHCLPRRDYLFYLCGRGQMILDAMTVIDRIFPDSRVFTEPF